MPTTPPIRCPDDLISVEQVLAHFQKLDGELEQVREGLAQSHRLATLGTIASIIAHEYNNLLTPVISYAELALATPEDAAMTRKALERAVAGARRASKISQSLLGFAREADDEHVAPLPAAIDDALACLGRDPRKDRIELHVDVPDVTLALPPVSLQQVVLNLLLNARQAMKPHGGELRVTGRVEGRLLHLEIADTGPGVPAEIEDRLFEPFVTRATAAGQERAGGRVSTDSTARRPLKGTGLGLCICRDLVREAGGSISHRRPASGGAAFHVTLPLADDVFSVQ